MRSLPPSLMTKYKVVEMRVGTTDAISECLQDRRRHQSIGHGLLQRVLDSDANFVTPKDMLVSLRDNDRQLGANL